MYRSWSKLIPVFVVATLGALGGNANASAVETSANPLPLPQVGPVDLPQVVQQATATVEQATGAALPPPAAAPAPPPLAPPAPPAPPANPTAAPPEAGGGSSPEAPAATPPPASPTYYAPDYSPEYASQGAETAPPSGGGPSGGHHLASPLRAEGFRRADTAAPTSPRPSSPAELLARVGSGPRALAASLGQLGAAAFRAISGGTASLSGAVAAAEPVSRPAPEQTGPRLPPFGPLIGTEPPVPAVLFFLLLAAAVVVVWAATRRQLGRPVVPKHRRH